MTPARRAVAVATLVALLASAGAVDHLVASADPRFEVGAPEYLGPVAAPAGALSSTWFCPLVRLPGVRTRITVANAGPEAATGEVTLVSRPSTSGSGDDASTTTTTHDLSVGAATVMDLDPAQLTDAPYAAATVEVDRGEVAVEATVMTDDGRGAAPCSPSASDRWLLANGSSLKGATEWLALHNPFPDDAVVEVGFVTDEGVREPPDLQGFLVPARGLEVLDLSEHGVDRRALVATRLVARSGRVVLARAQRFDGTRQPAGLDVTLAVPRAGTRWAFPEGRTGEEVRERYLVYNPTDEEVSLDLAFSLDEGEVEPIVVTVPAESVIPVDPADAGLPADVGHSALFRSLDGVPVVVEREVVGTPEAARPGWSSAPGARVAARRWLHAAGEASSRVDQWLMVQNPGDAPVTATVTVLAGGRLFSPPSLESLEIPAGGRASVRLGDHLHRRPLATIVEATAPVVVERGLFVVGATGLALTLGVPLRPLPTD